jgi:hypothetical protein
MRERGVWYDLRMNGRYLVPVLVGVASGVLDAGLVMSGYVDVDSFMVVYAGIPYGVVTAIYFLQALYVNHKFARAAGWVVIAGAAYYLAVLAAAMGAGMVSNSQSVLPFAFAGFVGSLLLSLGFSAVFQKMKCAQVIVVVVTGTIVATGITALCVATNQLETETFFLPLLYISWQTAVTVALAASFLSRPVHIRNVASNNNLQVKLCAGMAVCVPYL